MADRHTLHFKHLDRFKSWLIKNEWEIKPLSRSPYEVLRAVKNGRWVIIYIKDEATEHYSLTENSIPVVNQWLREVKLRKKICDEIYNKIVEIIEDGDSIKRRDLMYVLKQIQGDEENE